MALFFRQDWLWGLLAIALLATSLVLLYKPSTIPDNHLRLSAVFDDVSGLHIGSPVMLSGFVVGSVEAISITQNLRVEVDMRFNPNLEIPDDSDIRIASTGVFSAPTLTLGLGGSFDPLLDGDTFYYSQSGVDFLRLFQQIVDSAAARAKQPKTE